MEFESKHLLIKKFIPEYIGVMYDTWGTDKEVGRYMPGFRVDWDESAFSDYVLKTYKDEYHIRAVIQDKETNRIIGNISLYQEDSRSKSVNIWLVRDSWNKGYGTEVMKALVKEIKKTKLESLYATTDKRNIAATKILEKCGFELIDTIKDYREDIDGSVGDELLFELEFKR